jgi:hypothetical protein
LALGPGNIPGGTGALNVIDNGRVKAQQIVIGQNGWLGGDGFVEANVLNLSGMVSPGTSPGELSIFGNYTQGEPANLLLEIASSSVFDKLIVSGTATLNGSLTITADSAYVPPIGTSFEFLSAESISGNFASIVDETGLGFQLAVVDGTIRAVTTKAIAVPTWNADAGGAWSLPSNWSTGVPNSAGAQAVFGTAITTPRTVTVDESVTVGRLAFESSNAYTIAGTNGLTLDATSGSGRIDVTSGSHLISAPITLADDAVITITPAASILTISGNLGAAGRTLTKAGAGSLTVNNVRSAGLTIDGGTVAITANGTPAGTSVVASLSIAGGAAPAAKLDLTNNAAIVNYSGASPLGTVRSQLIAGRGGPGFGANWTGQGIASSAAAAANAAEAESRSIGIAENATLPLGPYTTFAGQPVDNTSLLIAFTRTGDANLDGMVDDDDVTIVGASYAPGVAQPSWALGDFDYNGFVDDDDVTLLGAFYDPSAAPLVAAAPDASITVAAVPEPQTVALLLMGIAAIAVGSVRRVNRLA